MAPRKSSEQRLDELVAAGAAVFAAKGLRRARMDEIARTAGVSPGNVYNYVTGKEALFALVIKRSLNGDGRGSRSGTLPLEGPPIERTIAWIAKRLDFVSDFPELEAALVRRRVRDGASEVEALVGELFDAMFAMRDAVAIIERSAPDMPHLAELFLGRRRELFARWRRYLERRIALGVFPPLVDPGATARLVIEAAWWAARRRPLDRDPRTRVPDEVARAALVEFAVRALLATTTESAKEGDDAGKARTTR